MAKCCKCASLFIPAKLPSLRLWPALFFACLFAISLPTAASSSYSNWIGDPSIAEARLISAVTARGDLDQMPLGLEFRLAPNWKIYWRTPGEAGLPPTINLFADGDQVAQTLGVFGVLGVDLFVELQRALVVAHPPITTRDHQSPFDFFRLDLGGPFKEVNRLLVHLGLHVPDAQPANDVQGHGVVPIGLQMKMKSLGLVVVPVT